MEVTGASTQSISDSAPGAVERTLRTTFDLAPIGLAQFDEEGHFILVNDRMCEILDCTRDSALARTFQELTFPDDLPHCLELSAQLAANEIPNYCVEKRFVRSDESVVWTRITVSAARKENGAVDYFIGAAEDITAQIEAMRALEIAELRLRTATDASSIGTFRFDVRRHVMVWADGMQRVFGSSTDVTLDEIFERIHPDDRDQVMRAYLKSASDGSDFEEEFRSVWPDGSLHWLHDRARMYPGEDGKPAYIIGAITDVTRFKGLEVALRHNEAQFRALADSIPQLAWISDADGNRSWFNARWCSYFDCNVEDMSGTGWLRVHDPDKSPGILDSQRRAFQTGSAWEDTVRLRGRDGSYRWFLSRAMPVSSADGAPVRWIGTNTDITDQLESQRKLSELLAREQVGRQAAERARMVREQVLGLVAHDLRNPVHTIVMAAGALIDIPFGPEDRRKQLELISRCAGTMERLIADLLDVHRIDAGTFAVKRERIPVAPITQEVCDRFRDDAATRGVTLAAHVEPELPLILGDRERLVQALSNLVSNAIRFTPHDGRIEIGAKCQGDKLCLTVQDTGAGIAPDKISAVFERFWQGDRTSGGAGLGLAIVKGIVASHDGAIKVESVVGQGTTFSLIFPSAAVR